MSMFGDIASGAAWDALEAVHGTAATYYSASADTSTSIVIVWTPGEVSAFYARDGEQRRRTGLAKASAGDVTSPDDRDTYTIGSDVYAVDRYTQTSPRVHVQLVELDPRTRGGPQRLER